MAHVQLDDEYLLNTRNKCSCWTLINLLVVLKGAELLQVGQKQRELYITAITVIRTSLERSESSVTNVQTLICVSNASQWVWRSPPTNAITLIESLWGQQAFFALASLLRIIVSYVSRFEPYWDGSDGLFEWMLVEQNCKRQSIPTQRLGLVVTVQSTWLGLKYMGAGWIHMFFAAG
jgi:hypothetical protein